MSIKMTCHFSFIKVHLTQLDVWVRCWQKRLSPEVTLYLLDTDTDQNHLNERSIAASLYAGTEEAIIKQQLILGIGGVKLLHQLGIHPRLYHLNEGRPAFLHWQLIRSYMDEHGMDYEQARQLAISRTVYTNHTLVGAGNQTYDLNLVAAYSQYYAQKMGIAVDQLFESGRTADQRFDVTQFALSVSRRVSAVSQVHLKLCQVAWPSADWVGITNGVHLPTWQQSDIRAVASDPVNLWHVHQQQKAKLAAAVLSRTGFSYDPERLIISWARRIATYKQLPQLFTDLNRLKALVNQPGRPIQFLLAGKAHIYDTQAKQLIQEVVGYCQRELSGHALFIPNYDLDIAQSLVAGSDLWLNTPELGKEASGTSGMKASSNGVLQCTVADGWAAEVPWTGLGWELAADRTGTHFYELLETEIGPLFWDRDPQGTPTGWVERMQKTIKLADHFSSTRMLAEYRHLLYQL
jgi:glucan phosphorylase